MTWAEITDTEPEYRDTVAAIKARYSGQREDWLHPMIERAFGEVIYREARQMILDKQAEAAQAAATPPPADTPPPAA